MSSDNLQLELTGKDPETVLRRAWETYGEGLVLATSLSPEDQVITEIIARNKWSIPLVTLDTGRLFPETYTLIEETEKRYGVKIQVYFPDHLAVEDLVLQKGVNSFYQSVENRKECCRIRKLEPLKRALAPYKAWICGLRREQSVTRLGTQVVEQDPLNGLVKINPLIDWTEEQVWGVIAARKIPYHPLHDQGYPSIGCACCTRAIKKTESLRAGRWWWEEPEHKECGLHAKSAVIEHRTSNVEH